MPEEIVMPRLSDTMQEGTIARWVKHEGEAVKTGDVLMEVETDKATLELNSYHDGTLARIIIGDGGSAPVGTVVGILSRPGETLPADASGGDGRSGASGAGANGAATARPGQPPDAGQASHASGGRDAVATPVRPASPQPERGAPAAAAATTRPASGPTAGAVPTSDGATAEAVKASPLARVMAEAAGVDLRAIAGQGSGPSGRIVRADVEALAKRSGTAEGGGPAARPATPDTGAPATVEAPAAAAAADSTAPAARPAGQDYEDVALSRMRAGIARNIGISKPGIPHIYLTIEVEMDAALAFRKQLNELVGSNERARLTVNDLVIKGAALALRKFPELNAWFLNENPPQVRAFKHVNLGLAVPVEGGLVVPVLRDADAKTFGTIATETKDIYDRVRAGKPTPDEYTGGTFTVSNLGQYGIDEFQAVINPPQAGILAVGTAAPRPVVRDGEMTVRTIMRATLSSDHRVVDGVYSAQYLSEFKRLLETPLHLVL